MAGLGEKPVFAKNENGSRMIGPPDDRTKKPCREAS
jgi:hypothetical protein